MRNLLASFLLVLLALSGAAPACAHPAPVSTVMTHHAPKPGHCDSQAAAHTCIGCGVTLPDLPRMAAIGPMPIALPPLASKTVLLAGTLSQQPLRPPRLLA